LTTLRSWYLAGRRIFVARLAAVASAAGLASWLLALALHPLFGVNRPSRVQLLFALVLGAFVGGVLGFALGAYWDRTSGQRNDRP
jgi:hypothetical protein